GAAVPASGGSTFGAASTCISCVHSPFPVRRSDSLNLAVSRWSSPSGRPSSRCRMSCTSSLVKSTSALRCHDRDDAAEVLEHVVSRLGPGRGDRPGGAACPHRFRPALQQDEALTGARALGERPLDVLRRPVVVLDPPPGLGEGAYLVIVQACLLAQILRHVVAGY